MILRRGLAGTTKMQNESRHHLDGDSSYGYAFLETEEKICLIFFRFFYINHFKVFLEFITNLFLFMFWFLAKRHVES